MAKPTFPQQHIPDRRGDIDEIAHFFAGLFDADRGGHHHCVPGVFEFDRAGTLGHRNIGCPRNYGMGMNVGRMRAALGQDIDP